MDSGIEKQGFGSSLPFRHRADAGIVRVVCQDQRSILPAEVLVEVFKYFSARDKRNARKVCRSFADAALPSLTTTAYLSPRERVLMPIQELSRHPVVCKYIKRVRYPNLCYRAETLTELRQVICYGAELEWRLEDHSLRQRCKEYAQLAYSTSKINGISERYSQNYDREAHISGNGRLQAIFGEILGQFVKLEHVTFADHPPLEDMELVRNYAWPAIPPNRDLWGFPSPYHVFVAAIRSMSVLGIKV